MIHARYQRGRLILLSAMNIFIWRFVVTFCYCHVHSHDTVACVCNGPVWGFWHQSLGHKYSLHLYLITGCIPLKFHAQLTISQSCWVNTVENSRILLQIWRKFFLWRLIHLWISNTVCSHENKYKLFTLNHLVETTIFYCTLLFFTIKVTKSFLERIVARELRTKE